MDDAQRRHVERHVLQRRIPDDPRRRRREEGERDVEEGGGARAREAHDDDDGAYTNRGQAVRTLIDTASEVMCAPSWPKALNEESTAQAPRGFALARTYAFALVPLIGVLELGAHEVQIHSVVRQADWDAARAAVEAEWKPGDLVVFEPFWADSIGRMHFGAKLAGIPDEARPNDTRFPRAFEVSIRGAHDPELADWTKVATRKVGAITITTLANPMPVHVIDDLVDARFPTGMAVTRQTRWRERLPLDARCHDRGGLGAGPATPGERFVCAGGAFVGVSLIHDLTDRPRRCYFAPTVGRGGVVRVRFTDVAFGSALHGHVGLANFNERDRTGPNVTLTWRANDRILGKITHVDGDGWKGYELSTSDLTVSAATSSPRSRPPAGGRQYCFEADTQ